MEEVDLPVGEGEVDIIISEWMGYFLLYESMLDSVLFARDKYLRQGGLLFPDKAALFVCGIEDAEYKEAKIEFWSDVYGFDMSPIKRMALAEPLVDLVDGAAVITDCVPVLHVDLRTVRVEELSFSSGFSLACLRDDLCHAIVAYFEVAFSAPTKPIIVSTSPHAKYTHWKQTVFYLEQPLEVCRGEVIQGEIACNPNARNARDLDIALEYSFEGDKCSQGIGPNGPVKQFFRLR
jgi:protein arginine N-methyltransferase 1